MLKRAINVGQRSNWENTATPSMATIRGVISPLFAVDDAHTAQCLGDESFLCKNLSQKNPNFCKRLVRFAMNMHSLNILICPANPKQGHHWAKAQRRHFLLVHWTDKNLSVDLSGFEWISVDLRRPLTLRLFQLLTSVLLGEPGQ